MKPVDPRPDAGRTLVRLGLALLALAFLMPGHFDPWRSFQSQWVASCGGVIVALGAARAAAHGQGRLRWPAASMLACAMALVPLAQWAGGQVVFLSDAVVPALYWVGFGLCVVAGDALAQRDRTYWTDALFMAFVVASSVSVAIALLQWQRIGLATVWVVDLARAGRPYANLAQPNQFATLAVLGLVGVLRAFERRTLDARVAAALAAWQVFGVVMAQSRAAWIAAGLLVLWWAVMRRRVGLRTSGLVVGAGLVSSAVAIAAWAPLNAWLLLQAPGDDPSGRLQAGPRALIWRAALEALGREPWTGYGWNQIGSAQLAVATSSAAVNVQFDSAHSVVLDLALWAGVPAAVLCAAAAAVWLLRRMGQCADLDGWTALAAVGVIGAHAMVEYPLQYTYYLLPLGLLVGLLDGPARAIGSLGAGGWQLTAPAMAMAALVVWIGVEYLRVEQAHRDLRLQQFGIGAGAPPVPPPQVLLLDAPRELHRLMAARARAGMGAEELDQLRRAVSRYPFPPAMLRLAVAVGLNGAPDEAALILRRLCAMHPSKRCAEARESWRVAGETYPELRAVPAP